jgi:hypothetical protein
VWQSLISLYSWPPIISWDLSDGTVDSYVACDWYVMVLRDNPLSKVCDLWYQHFFIKKQNTLVIFPPFIPPLGCLSLNVSIDLLIFIVFSDFFVQCFFLVYASDSTASKSFCSSCCLHEIFYFNNFCFFLYFSNIIWATRSPSFMSNSCFPWLNNKTLISPL